MVWFDGTHLIGDVDDMHNVAADVGLQRAWFQNHKRHPHYDVFSKRIEAKLRKHERVKLFRSARAMMAAKKTQIPEGV